LEALTTLQTFTAKGKEELEKGRRNN